MSEVRRVLLANGQYIEIVQETGSSTGAVMSQNAVTAVLNMKANSSHTHAASDITSGTFSSARIADSAVTSAKVADGAITRAKLASDVPISVTQYETVTVTGVCSDGSFIAGKQLSIGGSLYEFDNNGVVSANIPYGQAYTIRPIPNNLYFSNDFYAFTAATANRSVAVSYTVGSGVYIEDKQGMLYATADWSSGNNANANSVVVLSGIHNFKIALTQAPYKMSMGNGSEPFNNYLLAMQSMDVVQSDYNGAVYTQLIVTKCQPSTEYAAGWCNAYTFPDGKTKGYLPSLGELSIAQLNKAAVDAALTKCGGTALPKSSHWSSTYESLSSGNHNFWYFNLNYSEYGVSTLNGSNYVRPFGVY